MIRFSLKDSLRHISSLSAFTLLIAAVTVAFASSPTVRTEVTVKKALPSMSITPMQAVRLAEASLKKSRQAPKVQAKGVLSGTLNINTASALQLTKLPGIGPKKADRIVGWRTQHGKFGRVVDLRRVKGFGAKSVKKLLPYLAIRGENTLQ